MTVQNAFIMFLLAFSGITGWLMLREPATITVAGKVNTPRKKATEPKPSNMNDAPPVVSIPDEQSLMRSRLSKTILPVLDLENVTIEEAVEFLRLRTLELASFKNTLSNSLSFLVSEQEFQENLITAFAEDISLTDALDLICEKAGCHWEIIDAQVVITP